MQTYSIETHDIALLSAIYDFIDGLKFMLLQYKKPYEEIGNS